MGPVIRLEGRYEPYSDDELEGLIEAATLFSGDEGRSELVLRGRDEDGTNWEAHLRAEDGREFSGPMRSSEWDFDYFVRVTLWVSPTSDGERLLLGTYSAPDEDDVAWSVTLWPPEDDE